MWSIAEVAKHNKPDDLLIIVQNKVRTGQGGEEERGAVRCEQRVRESNRGHVSDSLLSARNVCLCA